MCPTWGWPFVAKQRAPREAAAAVGPYSVEGNPKRAFWNYLRDQARARTPLLKAEEAGAGTEGRRPQSVT